MAPSGQQGLRRASHREFPARLIEKNRSNLGSEPIALIEANFTIGDSFHGASAPWRQSA
jgi:hypothetical protein